MPESKSDQVRHRNEEISNFLAFGDARGPGWLSHHPADAERAIWTLRSREVHSGLAPAEVEVVNQTR